MEVNDAMNYIYEAVGTDIHTNIIFGTVVNENVRDEIRITVIATSFEKGRARRADVVETQQSAPRPAAVPPAAPAEPLQPKPKPPVTAENELDIPSFLRGKKD